MDGLADEEASVGGVVAGHLLFLEDGRAATACWPGGLFVLGDDCQERGFQGLRLGVEDDQVIEDLLPHRFAGQVSVLVPDPGTWRDTPGRKQDPGKITGPERRRRAGIRLGEWHLEDRSIGSCEMSGYCRCTCERRMI